MVHFGAAIGQSNELHQDWKFGNVEKSSELLQE